MHNSPAAGVVVGRLGPAPEEVAVKAPIDVEHAAGRNNRDRATSAEEDAARQVLREHRRVCVPEPACNGCLATWPCPDVVWAWHTLPDEQ
jgi:hypothetical protein